MIRVVVCVKDAVLSPVSSRGTAGRCFYESLLVEPFISVSKEDSGEVAEAIASSSRTKLTLTTSSQLLIAVPASAGPPPTYIQKDTL